MKKSMLAIALGTAMIVAPLAAEAGTNTPRYGSNYNNLYKTNAKGFMEPGTVGNAAPTGSEAERSANLQPSAGGNGYDYNANRYDRSGYNSNTTTTTIPRNRY